MFKSKRVFIRNMISSAIPVVLVLAIAVSFLNRSFRMMEGQKRSIIQTQAESVLHDIDKELATSNLVADQICVDSDLTYENMLEHGLLTLKGIERLSMYRLYSTPQIFLTYVPEQLITKNGTCSREVYATRALGLTEDSIAVWERAFEAKENMTTVALENSNGRKFFLMLYHYPQSQYVDEKWVGFLFDQYGFGRILSDALQNLNAVVELSWNEHIIAIEDHSDNAHSDKAAFVESVRSGQAGDDYVILECQSQSYGIQLALVCDSGVLMKELRIEAVKMFAIGLATVALLSCFIWYYGKYRYRILYEIKQLAVSGRPELGTNIEADEYEIIRMVLKQNFEELKTKDDDLALVRERAKQQMSWMLLCAPSAEGIDVSQLMEGYGIKRRGGYCCTMLFQLKEKLPEGKLEIDDIPEILVHYSITENTNHYFALAISLADKDMNHQRRKRIAQIVMKRMADEDVYCRAVSCGLVYEELTQLSTSKQEAFSVLQVQTAYEGSERDVLFFDKLTHLTNNIAKPIEDSLNQFTEALCDHDSAEALNVLKQLLGDVSDEEQLSYVKYILVSSLIDIMYGMEIPLEHIDDFDQLMDLNSQSFEKQISALLPKLLVQLKKKDVADTQILYYIERNYNNSEISMHSIAEHFGISERSVSRILKKATDKTYKEYLNQIRLERACKLLAETDLDIRMIIKEVGCYDVSSFNRLFKQVFQMTPMEYRAEYGKSEK